MFHVFQLLFIAIVVAAAVFDFRQRRIPNFLSFTVMAAALPVQLAVSGAAGGLFWLLGLLAGAGLLLVPYAMGGMGAGDLKFLACAGCVLGPVQVFYAFLAASLLGGLMAIGKAGERAPVRAPQHEPPRPAIPYGLPLAAGVLLGAIGAWL